MKFIQGKPRTQIPLFTTCLEEAIDKDSDVRIIDLFVDSLKLQDYGFKMDFIENGRPAYHPGDLLKLYLYGYLNRMRSSRTLERECKRNIELMWLLKGLVPDHNTISNFRRDNPKAIKKVFRATVEIAKNFKLIGGVLIAGDSTKLRAQNSKKNNYNPKKIERHIAYIDNKLNEYNTELAKQDGDSEEKKEIIRDEIKKHEQRKEQYNKLQQQLEETGETQISTSDPDSRQMIIRNMITEVAYNVQSTVDSKHNIPIDFKTTNANDSKAMGNMLQRAKAILRTNQFIGLYDKGYHTGSEFKTANALGIDVMVAIPAVASNAPDTAFNVEHFIYNTKEDTYTCPAGETLKTNGSWYKKDRGKSASLVKHYKTPACQQCKLKEQCTRNPKGRLIERPENAELIEQNRKRIEANKTLYKQRQSIVEHPYGTIKRQWGFCHIITKRWKQRADADIGLMFTAYNLRRLINIIGKDEFRKYLKVLLSLFFAKNTLHKTIKRFLNAYENCCRFTITNLAASLNRLIFTKIYR